MNRTWRKGVLQLGKNFDGPDAVCLDFNEVGNSWTLQLLQFLYQTIENAAKENF